VLFFLITGILDLLTLHIKCLVHSPHLHHNYKQHFKTEGMAYILHDGDRFYYDSNMVQHYKNLEPTRSKDSPISSVVTRSQNRYPRNQGSIPGRSKRFFSSPKHPVQLWGSPSLLPNECQGTLPLECSRMGVKLTSHHSTTSQVQVKNERSYTSTNT
jgi:hypothetical protein